MDRNRLYRRIMATALSVVMLLGLLPVSAAAGTDVFDYANAPESGTMYLRVQTPTNNSQFGLPVCGNSSENSFNYFDYNWVIDWGDGTASQVKTGTSSASGRISHSYNSAGTYTVAIKPNGTVSNGWFRAFGADKEYNKFNMITGFAGVLDDLSMNLSSGDYCAAEMFHGCAELTAANIRFQQNATTVGDYFASDMFFGCTALTSLPADFNLPQNLETVGASFAYHMFDHCDALPSLPTDFNLPQNITTAKDFFASAMFNNCGSLESLPTAFNLPQNLTTVGNNFANAMFAACTSLKSLPTDFNLPQNLTTVGYGFAYGMFIGCISLESLPTAFNLPQNLETVGDFFASEMFSGCTSLKSLSTDFNLPQKLPTVGASFAYQMFYNCTSLESLPTGFNLSPNLTTVGNSFAYRMFYSCTSLKSLPTSFSLPQKLTTVGLNFAYAMFYNCRNLKINSAFRFPNLDQDQINQSGVFYRAFSEIAADQNIGEAAAILSNLTDNTNTDFSGITKIFPKDDRDTFSNAFNNDVSWNKIHANWKVTDSTYKDYPPTVGSVTPSGTDSALSGKVVVTFSEAMDTSTSAVGTVVMVDSTNDEETSLTGGSWSEDSKTYTVSYSGLTAEKTYFLFISGFKDAAGNVMDYDNPHTFTTAAASVIWDGTTKDKSWYNGHESDFSYIITTAEQLAGFEELVNGGTDFTGKTVTLGADIELNDVTNVSSWDGETTGLHNWTAIGTYTKPFAGTFDGDGHTVSGIYIKSSDGRQALFGMVATGGTVKNLGVVDSYIQGDANVAGVVGSNSGTVENCYNKATVLGYNQNVGGIVGTNYNGTIKDCYNAGTVMGGYNYVGGLVGSNTGTIQGCYNTGDVTGIGGIGWIGGVAGINKEGTITKCYNTGAVKGDLDSNVGVAGGIAGSNCSSIENCYNLGSVIVGNNSAGGVVAYNGTDSSVKNCYNAGSVTSTWEMRSKVGGVAGTNEGTISGCYYDNTVCTFGAISDADVAGQAVGKAIAWMQNATTTSGVGADADTFSGWDPSVWGFKAGKYPDFHPLNVVSVTPADTNATASGSMSITFSEAMDKAAGTVKLTNGTAVIALSGGTWSEDGKTYTVPYSDLAYGTKYTVEIADFKAASGGSAMSADSSHTFTTKTVDNALTGTATITGDAVYGEELTASLTGGNSEDLSYQWTRDGKDINGATDSTYMLGKDDVGKEIAVKISSSDKNGTQTSAATDEIAKADCPDTAVSPSVSENKAHSIKVNPKDGYEYLIVEKDAAISTGTWQDSNTFTGLSDGTEYDIYQRIKETDTNKVSAPSKALTVRTKVTLTYKWNYDGAAEPYTTEDVSLNEMAAMPAVPQRAGYTFGGWYEDSSCGDAWNFNTRKVDDSRTLYAKWSAKTTDTLEVTYANGGADSGSVPRDEAGYSSGATVTVKGNTGILSRSGYSFGGWNDGTTTYAAGDTFAITSDTVLTAVWTENTTQYTVTFSSNYSGDGNYTTQTVTYGALLTKPTAPTRAGYTFIGWYKDAACKKAWSFTLDTVSSNMTLYANWAQGTYSVSGTVVDNTSSAVEYATVKVMQGNVQFGNTVQTDVDGKFTITGVPNGEYNIVVTKDGQMVTLHITVDGSNYEYSGNIRLPGGNTNSKLDIVGSDTPNIVESGLHDLFNNTEIYGDTESNVVNNDGTVEIRLTVQKDDGSDEKDTVTAQMSTAGYEAGIVLDLDIEMTATDSSGAISEQKAINELDDTLTLIIPLPAELQGKDNYVVYRMHDYGDDTTPDVRVEKITTTDNDGEYIEVSADKTYLTLYAKYFSTYAIGYSESSGGTPISGGSSATQSYTITVPAEEGGSISPSGSVSVAKGTDKTFTFTPKEGYVVSDVLIDGKSVGAVSSYTFSKVDGAHTIEVVFVKAEGLPYYVDKNGGKVFIGFASSASGEMKYIAPEGKMVEFTQNPKYFTDISGHWAKSNIDFITQREIFLGTKADAFLPDTGMTRAMFAAVIGRLYERSYGAIVETENTFSDVRESAYYAKYVSWAEKNGIILGINENQFAPNREITRQQMAAILYRFAEFLKVSGDSANEKLNYSDSAELHAWAIDAVKYCQKNGIILGRSDGSFAPRDSATRAEVATILARFVETVVS